MQRQDEEDSRPRAKTVNLVELYAETPEDFLMISDEYEHHTKAWNDLVE